MLPLDLCISVSRSLFNHSTTLSMWSLSSLLYNDVPVTCGRNFIYADDICLAIQGQYFSELECSRSSDMAQMSHFCRQWRHKPSASKIISSVFHLHNTSATRELSVYLDGQHHDSNGNAMERRSHSFLYNGNVIPVVFFLYTPIVNCNFQWKSFGYKPDSLASWVHACKQ